VNASIRLLSALVFLATASCAAARGEPATIQRPYHEAIFGSEAAVHTTSTPLMTSHVRESTPRGAPTFPASMHTH
jgi:hypothetical protein